ncbi:MAG TPA: HlyD family efflux transporter periplasmic adaptor subunit, partial [Vicinamibacteria bacterium]
ADDGSGDVLVLAAPESGLLGAVRVAVGQPVAAGVALFDVVPRDRLWIKVAVYVGDLGSIDTAEPAGVRRYSAPPGTPPKAARPIDGPPSADPVAATSDLYYELTAPGWGLRPGQRVEVTLPLRETKSARVVPWEAVVFDIHGGAWVYERREPHVFVRRRVDVLRVDEALAVIARGPEEGTPVVTGGAAELFGAELGFGK